VQRLQYAKAKSDCLAKAEGTFVPKDKKRKQEEKGFKLYFFFLHFVVDVGSMIQL
jgi:hypothetical protein